MPAEATVFHLVRHACYDLLDHVLAGRTPGHRLNLQGRAEALVLAKSLSGLPIGAVVASPLERARETAEAIAQPHCLPVTIEPGVNEIEFGEWTGSPFEALHAKPTWRAFNRFRGSACPPGGETMLDVQQRGVGALLRLRDLWLGKEVVVVSHGDPIKAILAHFLAIPLDLFHRIEIAPASRSIVRLFPDDVRIDAVNLPVNG